MRRGDLISQPARAILAVAVAAHVIIAALAFQDAPEPQGDFDRYYQIASAAGRPYVDYQVEHPIGTLLLFKLLALPGDRPSFGRGVVAVNCLADAIVLAVLLGAWGTEAAAFYALVTAPIASLLFHRIDFWSMSSATLAIAAWRRRWPGLSGGALAIGVSFKLWPLVLAGALWWSANRRRALTTFAAVAGALAGIALLSAGARSVLEVLTFRGATGWQIESSVGSVIHAFTTLPVREESGAFRIGAIGRLTSIALFALAAPICVWASGRGFRLQRAGTAWLAAVGGLLTLSALLSAQYVGWLVPGGAIAWREGNRRSAVLTVLVAWMTWAFMVDYDSVRDGAMPIVLVVMVRNVLLLLLTLDALLALASASLPEADLKPELPPV